MSISRPAWAALGALLIALSLAACGSSSGSGASTNASASGQGGARGGFGALRDPKVAACLKKQGVTLPGRPPGGSGVPPSGGGGQSQGGSGGQPPTGTNGQPPSGQRRRFDSSRFEKLRAALQKCGVNLPSRPQNGQPPGGQAPQGQGTSSTSAS